MKKADSTEKDVQNGTDTQNGEKVKVSIAISKSVYEKAHSLGINVSKASENVLKDLIQAIENRNNLNSPSLAKDSLGREALAGPVGFEPTTFSLEG